MHAGLEQPGGVRVPEVVKADAREVGLTHGLVGVVRERLRVRHAPVGASDDVGRAGEAACEVHLELATAVLAQPRRRLGPEPDCADAA